MLLQNQTPQEFTSQFHSRDEIEGMIGFFINASRRLRSASQDFSITRLATYQEIGAAFGEDIALDACRQIGFRLVDLGFYAAPLRDNEFGVLSGHSGSQEIVTILEKLNAPMFIQGIEIPVKVIVGSCNLSQVEDAKGAIRHARSALLDVKNINQHAVHHYESHQTDQLVDGIKTLNELERAINEETNIELWYQPQFCLLSGTTTGVEALVRWMRNGILVNPDSFIPIAESSGLMDKLGRLVIKKAFYQIAEWQSAGYQFNVAINLSAHQLEDTKLILAVDDLLTATGISTQNIEFELTETATSTSHHEATTIRELKRRGFQISMDDFGIGYSSLERLANKHYDKLKIDKEFVKNAPHNQSHRKICEMAVALAKILDIKVIAEGIETLEEESVMRAIGCTHVQGYLYSKPVRAEELIAAMITNKEILLESNLSLEEIQDQSWFRRIVQARNASSFSKPCPTLI